MNDFKFDTLKSQYIDSLVELEKTCFAVPWTKNMFLSDITNQNAYYVLAIKNGNVVGYCGLYKVLDESSITNIAVHPEYRNKGLATAMLNKIFEHCINNNLSFITLEVRESNTIAIELYAKNGFIVVGNRKNYYSDNHETAILMTKYLKEV